MPDESENQKYQVVTRKDNEAKMDQHLQNLRNLLLQETDFISSMDDDFLVQFIRAKKYDINRAAKQVRRYWEIVAKVPEIAALLCPTRFEGIIESMFTIMKVRSKGRQILHVQCGKWDTTILTLDELFAMGVMLIDHMASSIETQFNGVLLILDLQNIGLIHILNTPPSRIQHMAKYMKDSYPLGFKGLYLLNTPSVFKIIYAIAKPLLTPKMRNRFFICGQEYEDQLVKSIGADALPEFLGGNIPNDECEDKEFYPSFFLKDDYYKKIHSYGFLRK